MHFCNIQKSAVYGHNKTSTAGHQHRLWKHFVRFCTSHRDSLEDVYGRHNTWPVTTVWTSRACYWRNIVGCTIAYLVWNNSKSRISSHIWSKSRVLAQCQNSSILGGLAFTAATWGWPRECSTHFYWLWCLSWRCGCKLYLVSSPVCSRGGREQFPYRCHLAHRILSLPDGKELWTRGTLFTRRSCLKRGLHLFTGSKF